MKFKEFLARRSTHSMNPESMSDEYNMNRRRSFGRGGAGNIRSREEAVTLPPNSMSMSIRSSTIHESQHLHLDHEAGSGGGDESASNSDDTETTESDRTDGSENDSHRPTSPYQFHYRYHYRHYRPGHFSGSSSSSGGSSSGSSSSAWSFMSISSSTGMRESVVLSGGRGRFLSGMRQVLSGGSGGSGGSGYGHGNGQSPR